MVIHIRKFIHVVLYWILFMVFVTHIRCYLIVITFFFDQLFLQQALKISVLLNFLIRLSQNIIELKICLVFVKNRYAEQNRYAVMTTFLVSYEVCSLFTSKPLQETIGIVVQLVFKNNPQLKVKKLEFKQLFHLLHQIPISF